jgi:hypothetical protein
VIEKRHILKISFKKIISHFFKNTRIRKKIQPPCRLESSPLAEVFSAVAARPKPIENPGSLRLPRHAPPSPALAGEGSDRRRRRGLDGGVSHQRRVRRRSVPPRFSAAARPHGGCQCVRLRPRYPGAHGSGPAGDEKLAALQGGKLLAL